MGCCLSQTEKSELSQAHVSASTCVPAMTNPRLALRVAKLSSSTAAYSNFAYMNQDDMRSFCAHEWVYVSVSGCVFTAVPDEKLDAGQIGLSSSQRGSCTVSVDDIVDVSMLEPPTQLFCVSAVDIDVELLSPKTESKKFEAALIKSHILKTYAQQYFATGQSFVTLMRDSAGNNIVFALTIKRLEVLERAVELGMLLPWTLVNLTSKSDALTLGGRVMTCTTFVGSSSLVEETFADDDMSDEHNGRLLDFQTEQLTPLAVEFSDLAESGSGCVIANTAVRAITVPQIEAAVCNARRRFALGEAWSVSRPGPNCTMADTVLTSVEGMNLYDVNTHIILPTTWPRRCAFVELVARKAQPPDFFASHFWGETVLDFLTCLRQHANDRGFNDEQTRVSQGVMQPNPFYLGKRSAFVWVCAYANRQHALAEEIAADLSETSFFRAMQADTTLGVISIVDSKGICFKRAWCCYEIFIALSKLRPERRNYAYDIYTALDGSSAVGLLDGLAVNEHHPAMKADREKVFPRELVDAGLKFQCSDSQASVEADRLKILNAISTEPVDAMLHGIIASYYLRNALLAGDNHYMYAIRQGLLRKLHLNLGQASSGAVDTRDTWDLVLSHLDPQTLEELQISASAVVMPVPERVVEFSFLVKLEFDYCIGLSSLPNNLGGLCNLTLLNLQYCKGLVMLPSSICELVQLKTLVLCGCSSLATLPDRFGNLTALQSLEASNCERLLALPSSFGELAGLKSLYLQGCKALAELPENFGGLAALEELFLDNCSGLTKLPDSCSELMSLNKLDLDRCAGLTSLPDLSRLPHLGKLCGLFDSPVDVSRDLYRGWEAAGRRAFAVS